MLVCCRRVDSGERRRWRGWREGEGRGCVLDLRKEKSSRVEAGSDGKLVKFNTVYTKIGRMGID